MKINKKLFVCTVIAVYVHSLSFGQKDSTRQFCDPKLEGMARSKGFSIAYERTLDSKITSTSDDPNIGNGSAIVGRNNRFDFRLKIPVWNRPGFKVVVGLKYFLEEFNFETPEGLTYGLYENLENKNLKSIGGNLTILKPLNETLYIGIRANADLNGDYSADEFAKASFLKYSFAAIYGWKKCTTKTAGLGLYYSYTFGRVAIYPVFAYSNTYNEHWGVEALLPASLKVRHNFSTKTLLYFGYEVEGNAYHIKIDNPPYAGYSSLELRRSNVRISADFEREIHDWLWFGISAGIRQPLAMNLSRSPSHRRENLITSKLAAAPFINFNIFIVPPRTLENKILYNR